MVVMDRHDGRRLTVLGASLFALSVMIFAPDAGAQAGGGAPRPHWIDRGLVTERRHLDLGVGLGFGYASGIVSGLHTFVAVPGVHHEISGGVAEGLEIGGGFGLRFWNPPVPVVLPDQYARVNREWWSEWAVGNSVLANPYVRIRYAFVNRGPVLVGIEGLHNVPFFGLNGFMFAVGVPVHIVLGHRVRLETGGFMEFPWINAGPARPVVLNPIVHAPLRVNVQIVPRLWLGARTAFHIDIVSAGVAPYAWWFEYGFQGGVRLHPRVDLQWTIGGQTGFHQTDGGIRGGFLDWFGGGLNLLIRLI